MCLQRDINQLKPIALIPAEVRRTVTAVDHKMFITDKSVSYHSLCIMFHQFHGYGKGIPLEPPILFGRLTDYHTRTKDFFSHPVRCRLSFTQRFFRYKAAHWWNLLPSDIKSHVQPNDFKNDVKGYLLSL